jgi:hypothetical protein
MDSNREVGQKKQEKRSSRSGEEPKSDHGEHPNR